MFDVVSDLKHRFESSVMDFYENWDHQDNCEWLVPEDTDDEVFLADVAKNRDKEEAAVLILDVLKLTIDAVPLPIAYRTRELHNSVGARTYEKISLFCVQKIGFELYPTDATEFVTALNEALLRESADP